MVPEFKKGDYVTFKEDVLVLTVMFSILLVDCKIGEYRTHLPIYALTEYWFEYIAVPTKWKMINNVMYKIECSKDFKNTGIYTLTPANTMKKFVSVTKEQEINKRVVFKALPPIIAGRVFRVSEVFFNKNTTLCLITKEGNFFFESSSLFSLLY